MVHPWEEPFLAGEGGSGAFFFTGCSLRCVFCQNHAISTRDVGEDLTPEQGASCMLALQAQGAENIDLVSPSHFAPGIVESLRLAKGRGLSVPVVWNSNAYELPETLATLAGLVDVFLPDLKHFDPQVSKDLCGAADYFERATAAIRCMRDIAGPSRFLGDRLVGGLAVRHLCLPGLISDSMAVLDWVARELPLGTPVSLMRQYTPMHRAVDGVPGYPALSRRLVTHEYRKVVAHAESLGFTNLWTQEKDSASDRFTPTFPGD